MKKYYKFQQLHHDDGYSVLQTIMLVKVTVGIKS